MFEIFRKKHNIFIYEEKNLVFSFVRYGLGGGLKALTDMYTRNLSFFLDGSPKMGL